ncbi:NUDIX domain-containing protein [Streptomyces sp. 4503]|uniref:NUDIX domain-containing protein n=2 Tax=Streptomyces TaxID=1883 RepID=A0ABS6CLS9_9ACTN|nr:NUDIX domain-containing protein [Streptomyces niphimycinicus]MBU3867875.1 NUDIX domain-containing protein [Streptomyces niphimycinicus]
MTERPVVKRTARAILLEGEAAPRMILIKRTKPGQAPYWITPGGGMEPEDATVVEALHREVDEELGAKVTDVVPAFVDTVPHPEGGAEGAEGAQDSGGSGGAGDSGGAGGAGDSGGSGGVKVQHFFVCRLASMDLTRRHGPEVDEPCGEYDVVSVPFTREGIASVEVVPPSLRAYLDANIEGVLALLADDLG